MKASQRHEEEFAVRLNKLVAAPRHVQALIDRILDGQHEPEPGGPTPQRIPQIVRRAEAARLLGVAIRTIDAWAAAGILRRVMLPGHRRGSGFCLADIETLIEVRP
jgi:hypothetical protein